MVTSFGGKVILPGDPDWYLRESEQLFTTAAAAVGPDAFVFSAALEGERYSLSDRYARFYRYDRGHWLCVEVAASLTDLLVAQQSTVERDGLVVLSADGEVWFVADNIQSEQIPVGDSQILGDLTRLRQMAGTYFAAGLSGQCYRRQGSSWIADDAGLRGFKPPFPRKRPGDLGETTDIKDVATLANGDQYLCGSVATARPAIFWRPGGNGRWQWLGYAIDDPSYDYLVPVRFLIEPPDTVWITTTKGMLVRGNAAQGFRIATDVAIAASGGAAGVRASFSNAVFYNDTIHAGSNIGPFRLRPDGGWDAFAPTVVQKSGEFPFANGLLEVADSVMWAFGVRSVARYDGQTWQPVAIPPLYARQQP